MSCTCPTLPKTQQLSLSLESSNQNKTLRGLSVPAVSLKPQKPFLFPPWMLGTWNLGEELIFFSCCPGSRGFAEGCLGVFGGGRRGQVGIRL